MNGKGTRRKGATGQSKAANLLRERDYLVDQKTAGIASEDLIATGPDGKQWSVEVKNCKSITPAHLKQAREQAKARKLPWMLMHHIEGTSSWLVRRQGQLPTVWHEKSHD